MGFLKDANWEDQSDPLRHILHPQTKTLLTLTIILLITVSITLTIIPKTLILAGIIGTLILWATITILHKNNVKYNPIAHGTPKSIINYTNILTLTITGLYIFAALMETLATYGT